MDQKEDYYQQKKARNCLYTSLSSEQGYNMTAKELITTDLLMWVWCLILYNIYSPRNPKSTKLKVVPSLVKACSTKREKILILHGGMPPSQDSHIWSPSTYDFTILTYETTEKIRLPWTRVKKNNSRTHSIRLSWISDIRIIGYKL